LPFQVSSVDGRNFVLLADAFYTSADGARYCLPAGAASDGASTPPEVWPLMPPFGKYWPAAYLHDAAYRNTLRVYAHCPRPSSAALAPPAPQCLVSPRQPASALRAPSPTPVGEGRWVRAALAKAKCDALLLEAMEALGVGVVERRMIYEGVVIGGTASFDQDRAANP